MSTGSGVIREIADNYPHRTSKSVEADTDAERILEGYIEQQGVERYSVIDSEFPYQALIGNVTDTEGEVTLTSRYTFPEDSEYRKGNVNATVSVNLIDNMLENDVIRENESIIDIAGVELDEDKEMSTNSGEKLRVQTVHCIVFYEEPVVSISPDTSFDDRIERMTAREATEEPSLATGIIHSGKKPSGENFAEARIDYWTRTFDGIEEGLDYSSIDWENP